MSKVPPTHALPPVEEPVPVQQFEPPVELVVHQGGIGIRKIDTPDGTLTLIQLMTPMGLMVTLKFDDNGVEHLIQQLKGSSVFVPPSLVIPGG